MTPRRVVMIAMPCAEVMEIGGTLDVFYAANVLLAEAGSSDPGYAIEVVSPVPIVRSCLGSASRPSARTTTFEARLTRGWRARHRGRAVWSASVRARSCSRRPHSWWPASDQSLAVLR